MNASLPGRHLNRRRSGWSDANRPVFKRLDGPFYSVDRALARRTVATVRVAARFFSGVPHPHLLGVRRSDWFPSVMILNNSVFATFTGLLIRRFIGVLNSFQRPIRCPLEAFKLACENGEPGANYGSAETVV